LGLDLFNSIGNTKKQGKALNKERATRIIMSDLLHGCDGCGDGEEGGEAPEGGESE